MKNDSKGPAVRPVEQLNLYADTVAGDFQPYLETYLLDDGREHGLVAVLPGGAYMCRADHEGRPVAERYNALGFHAVVIQYRTAPNRFPSPQLDTMRAIQLVRERAARWRVKSDKIALLGFSAGGHLAASVGTIGQELQLPDSERFSPLPNALILCYPVISGGEYGHRGSFLNLFGDEVSAEIVDYYSLEKRVTPATPPAFLWHTASDESVPVANSLLFAKALGDADVPFELHVFPRGPHGIGLADAFPEAAVWPDLSAVWLAGRGF